MSRLCPNCGAQESIDISFRTIASPIGRWSLAGAQMKFVVKPTADAHCTMCGFTVSGRLENARLSPDGTTFISGHFVANLKEEDSNG